jgi:hypothetical protein
MRPLDTNNEFTKTIKFDCEGKKLSFDVTTRVREAYSGKEMTQESCTKEVLDEIYRSFNVYC